MRLIIIFLFISTYSYSQSGLRDYQILSDTPFDSLYVMVNDTNSSSPTYKFGSWINARTLFANNGDRDWLKLGTVLIPTNSDSMFRTGYTLWTGENGGYPTKLEILKEGYIQFRNDSFNEDSRWIIKGLPHQTGVGTPSIGLTYGVFGNVVGDRDNQTMALGINPSTFDTDANALYLSWEDYYHPDAANAYKEFHLVHVDSSDVTRRVFSYTLNENLTNWNVYNTVDAWLLKDVAGDDYYARFTKNDGTNTSLYLNATSTGEGVQFVFNSDINALILNGVDGLGATSIFWSNLDGTYANKMRVIGDWGTFQGSDGLATKLWGSEAVVGGGMQSVTIGWGIDLASNVLKSDTAEVATQFDLNGVKWTIDADDADTELVSNQTIKFEGDYGVITDYDATGNILNIEADTSQLATQYDLTLAVGGSFMHWFLRAEDTPSHREITDADTVTFLDAGLISVTRTNDTILITGTEVDGSTTNEGQWTIDATGGDTEIVANQEIDFVGAGINATSYDATTNILTITGTEVDGDITNELQTLDATGASQPFTFDLSSDASDITVTGAGITTVTRSGNALTWTSTEVDGSTSNELNTIEEGNVSVQSSNTNLDFQSLFDVAADGAGEVNISLDLSEATTVTTAESDDYLIMHDAGSAVHQKMLWSDFVIDIIGFEEDDVLEGNGNTFDFGTGIDLGVVGAEANITLDFNEFTTDAATEGDEFVIVSDGAGVIEKVAISSFGGADGNGIFDSGNDGATVPTDMDVLMTDAIDFGAGTLYIDDTNNEIGLGTTSPDAQLDIEGTLAALRLHDTNGSGGNQITMLNDISLGGTGIFGDISYQYIDASTVEAFSLEANRRTNDKVHATFILRASEGTSTDAIFIEKNEDLSNNTHETTTNFNSGMRYSQLYESATNPNPITLDRGYYNVVLLTGHTGTITLPEIATATENYSSITSTTVGVGQEYLITNISGSTVTIARTSTDLINNAASITINTGDSYIVKAAALRASDGVGFWYTYD